MQLLAQWLDSHDSHASLWASVAVIATDRSLIQIWYLQESVLIFMSQKLARRFRQEVCELTCLAGRVVQAKNVFIQWGERCQVSNWGQWTQSLWIKRTGQKGCLKGSVWRVIIWRSYLSSFIGFRNLERTEKWKCVLVKVLVKNVKTVTRIGPKKKRLSGQSKKHLGIATAMQVLVTCHKQNQATGHLLFFTRTQCRSTSHCFGCHEINAVRFASWLADTLSLNVLLPGRRQKWSQSIARFLPEWCPGRYSSKQLISSTGDCPRWVIVFLKLLASLKLLETNREHVCIWVNFKGRTDFNTELRTFRI